MSDEQGSRVGSFVLGGIVGGLAGLAAGWMRSRSRPPQASHPHGLAAFEEAPCFHEPRQPERRDAERGSRPA